MRTRFVSATEEMDQEALARLFSEHHLLAIPILDAQGRMQGIVTIDDIVGVVEREAGEAFRKSAVVRHSTSHTFALVSCGW